MALSNDRITPSQSMPGGGAIPMSFAPTLGIADNVLIYAGAIAVVDSSGYARPGRNGTSTDVAIGIAPIRYDNTVSGHAAGALKPEIQVGVFGFLNDANAPILSTTAPGTAVYIYDDQTVTLTSGGNSKAGKLVSLASSGLVFVQMGPAAAFP